MVKHFIGFAQFTPQLVVEAYKCLQKLRLKKTDIRLRIFAI